ncbi:MAG: AMP-binding protein [Pseudorhodobacter sp.]|nr:AMP-binding protein [Frankiaceae bacterium]
MTTDDRPWLGEYPNGVPADLAQEFTDALAMFRAAVARDPGRTAVSYFGGEVTLQQVDEMSDALACALLANDFQPGDRTAVYLQNVPQYVLALVATWKAGGTMVSINPMSRERELTTLLTDSGARVLICLDDLYESVVAQVQPVGLVGLVITTSALEHRARDDQRLFAGMAAQRHEGTADLAELVEEFRGQQPPPVAFAPDDVALLTYTSGTTGAPKGAMNTHGNVTFSAQVVRDWCGLRPGDVILGVAPLFHITGLIAGIAASFLVPAELVLTYRFQPDVLLDAVRERRPTFTVAAITVFIAVANMPGVTREDLASLRSTYSGGAPVTPAWAARFEEQFGIRIHSMYGLTETTSPSHAVPYGADAPVDPTSGALSVGVPVPSTVSRIVGEDRQELPVGEVGEIVIAGPQVVPGYWGKPGETEHALPDGWLHTGDVGFMDERGYFYVVDRKKDMINASGYKVWPREVEDVLCEHVAVSEAAVVGIPDEYRGETVKAFVTLRPGAAVDPDELIAYCKARMSAYKYPRAVEIIDVLPKTATGKLLRRELPRTGSDAR